MESSCDGIACSVLQNVGRFGDVRQVEVDLRRVGHLSSQQMKRQFSHRNRKTTHRQTGVIFTFLHPLQ
jgi:hypothetical protein